MRYIHSGNSTLIWRKYRKKVLMTSTIIILLGNIGLGTHIYQTKQDISKAEKTVVQINNELKQDKGQINQISNRIKDDSDFKKYAKNDVLKEEVIPDLYPVDSLYTYIHEAPSTIIFSKIDLQEDVSYLRGQSTTYEELENYVTVLKESKLFNQVQIKNIEYISIGDKVEFELRALKLNLNEDEMEDLRKLEERGR